MTAHSALQHLKDVIAEEATLQAEIDKINAAVNHHQSAINTIGATQAATAQEVESATKRLSEALISAGEGGDSDPHVAQARTSLQAAIKAKDRAEAKASEAEAHKQAVATLCERARPIAERLMEIAKVKSEVAAERLREYGLEVASEHRLIANQLAVVAAKARALGLIALSANVSHGFTVLHEPPCVVVDRLLGDLGQSCAVTFEHEVPARRHEYIERLQSEGFNLIGAA